MTGDEQGHIVADILWLVSGRPLTELIQCLLTTATHHKPAGLSNNTTFIQYFTKQYICHGKCYQKNLQNPEEF